MTGPEHYRTAEQLAKGAARYPDSSDALVLAHLAQAHATLALAAPVDRAPAVEQDADATVGDITVFRASHESIVFGLYTNAAAARAHCTDLLRREWPTSVLDWIEDEEDGVAELVATSPDGEETATGYVVTALTAASAYDEEADE
jgi:hypothetical protein